MHIDIIVDSRGRGIDMHATPSEYFVGSKMSMDFQSVESVQVLNPAIPMSRPLINNLCDKIDIVDFIGDHITIYIPHGNYKHDPNILCQAINSELLKIKDQELKTEYNENTCRFSMSSNKHFSVLWDGQKKLARMLGFRNTRCDSVIDFVCGRFTILSKFVQNLDEDSCVQMVIPEISRFPLCVVTKKSIICPEVPVDSIFDKQLKCSFLDEDNFIYDFQNHNHFFMLRLKLSSHV
jgi:hypothetical protein